MYCASLLVLNFTFPLKSHNLTRYHKGTLKQYFKVCGTPDNKMVGNPYYLEENFIFGIKCCKFQLFGEALKRALVVHGAVVGKHWPIECQLKPNEM